MSLLKINYNITTTEKLLRSNVKRRDFLLQRGMEIDHENRNLSNEKGELEHLVSLTSMSSFSIMPVNGYF